MLPNSNEKAYRGDVRARIPVAAILLVLVQVLVQSADRRRSSLPTKRAQIPVNACTINELRLTGGSFCRVPRGDTQSVRTSGTGLRALANVFCLPAGRKTSVETAKFPDSGAFWNSNRVTIDIRCRPGFAVGSSIDLAPAASRIRQVQHLGTFLA